MSIAVPRPPDREGPDGKRAIWFVVRPDRKQLVELGRLFDGGQVRAIVSAIVPLAKGHWGRWAGPLPRRSGEDLVRVEG